MRLLNNQAAECHFRSKKRRHMSAQPLFCAEDLPEWGHSVEDGQMMGK